MGRKDKGGKQQKKKGLTKAEKRAKKKANKDQKGENLAPSRTMSKKLRSTPINASVCWKSLKIKYLSATLLNSP